MSALNPNRRGLRPAAWTGASPPGVWVYVFMSWSAKAAAELSLGRADEASAPTRAGLPCRAVCEGKMRRRLPARCRRYFADEASAPTRGGLACGAACEGKMGRGLPARCRRYFRFEASGPYARVLLLGNQ